MSHWLFRIRFRLPPNFALDHDASLLELPAPSGQGSYALVSRYEESINESEWLILRPAKSGFTTEHEALEAGRNAKNALMWCAARLYMGVDLGEDRANPAFYQIYLDQLGRENDAQVRNDVHGLDVYEEDDALPTRFASGNLSLRVSKSNDDFREAFAQAVGIEWHLTDSETLAFELYSGSHFESPRARFLTLVTTVEVLSERKERTSDALRHIEHLIEITNNSDLPLAE